jgi:hypothetical protein
MLTAQTRQAPLRYLREARGKGLCSVLVVLVYVGLLGSCGDAGSPDTEPGARAEEIDGADCAKLQSRMNGGDQPRLSIAGFNADIVAELRVGLSDADAREVMNDIMQRGLDELSYRTEVTFDPALVAIDLSSDISETAERELYSTLRNGSAFASVAEC